MRKHACPACGKCTYKAPCAPRRVARLQVKKDRRRAMPPEERRSRDRAEYVARSGKKHFIERRKTRLKAYRTAQPAKFREYAANYRAKKLRATPAWANREAMKQVYRLAESQRQMTGQIVQVDHIVPLNNPLVCGLHNEFNLQIVVNEYNMRKNNRSWPNMPD